MTRTEDYLRRAGAGIKNGGKDAMRKGGVGVGVGLVESLLLDFSWRKRYGRM